MNIFELFGKMSIEGLDKTKGQLSELEKNVQRVQKGLRVAGAAFTAMGAAGLAVVQSTKKINAQLGVTALNLGITTKEMRDLTLATTNVTFPIDEVTKTFDLLARAGVEDQQVLKDVATAFDTLGDAIGMPASLVTEKLIPTMKTFNLTAEEVAGKTDAMTYLFRNTTVSLDDFNRMVGYVTPDLVKMGLTTEDMIAILADLEAQGYSGEVMTREFRKAVTLATKEQIPLNEALGISTERIESYKEELGKASGITQEYADVANTQFTIMDKLKQKWSEVTLGASGFLEPLEPMLAGMTALGPLMMGLSTSAGTAAIKWGLHTAALVAHKVAMLASAIAIKVVTAAQWLWNAAMAANPIGILIIAIGALIGLGVLLWKNWDTIREKTVEIWSTIQDFFSGIWQNIVSIFKNHWDIILAILFPAVGIPLLIARHWDTVVEYFNKLWGAVTKIFTGIGQAMWEPIKNAIQWIIDYINTLIKTIQALFGMFAPRGGRGEGKGGRPYIGAEESARRAGIFQEYQGGGIVPGLPGRAVPVIAHGGEHIFEPGELSSFSAELRGIFESLSGSRETLAPVYLDGEKVGEVILRRSGEKYAQLSHIGGLNR